jgi:hypothetical protein
MKRAVIFVASMFIALSLVGRASAKKLDDFQRKELQEMRQERKDTKAELLDEERQQQEENFEAKKTHGQQRHNGDDLDDDDSDSTGGDD